MTLTNPNPVIIPAQPAQEFPHLWLKDIVISAPTTDQGMIYIDTVPYNQETKLIGDRENAVAIQTHDLWKAVNEVPEVAQAMFAIFQAVEPLRAWLDAKNTPVEPVIELIEEELTQTP
jgi:hypothetical protein